MSVKVKICGVTNFEDALSEIDAGIAGLKAIGTRRWLSLLHCLKADPDQTSQELLAAFLTLYKR